MNNLSRRSLIRGAAVLPATGLGLVSTADASSSSKPKFDEIYDVVIIGSGFSGLAAALAAREAGASAAVFEKMAFVGGNSSLSGGMFAVPGSSVQKEQGIKDSPEALMADMERIGLGLGDPQHIRFVCEHAAETFEWTRSYIGVDWNPTLTGKGGHSAERCLITRQGTGQGIIVPAVKKLASLGVKPRTGCFMEKILRSPEGRVQGVEIREGYVFGKPAAGSVKRIGARRAVVLACGGFAVYTAEPEFDSRFRRLCTVLLLASAIAVALLHVWRKHLALRDWLARFAVLVFAVLLFERYPLAHLRCNIDYGVWGILLILCLSYAESRWSRALVVLLWGALFYSSLGMPDWGSIRGTAAAALLLLLYNGERSRKPHPKLNKAFYAAYPLHLVVIWAMVIAAEGPLTQLKLLKYYL